MVDYFAALVALCAFVGTLLPGLPLEPGAVASRPPTPSTSLASSTASEPPAQPTTDDALAGDNDATLDVADAAADQPFLSLPHTAGCGPSRAPGDSIESADGRNYRLHLPRAYTGRTPAPIVLSFHGYGRTAEEQERYSGLVPVSDEHGFVLVTPEGSGQPQGWDIVGWYAEDGVDDVAWTQDLLAQIEDSLCIDPSRIYAIGISNGAEMASQLACDMPDTFAGVAAISGLIYQGCASSAVPIVAFHGTADENIPYAGVPAQFTAWGRHNGCETPRSSLVSEHVALAVASGCTDGADVELYTVDGGGHTWPGAVDNAGGVGATTHEIDANALAWLFFVAHPKPQ